MTNPMRRALQLAARGEGFTSPNPLVGAVIVDRSGNIVGEGYHARAGAPHAEAMALERAGEQAQGGTLYVTLEPCNHHGRTPPCTDAIIAAGIQAVHVAVLDPNPNVAGGGCARLESAGIPVVVGEYLQEAFDRNRPFFLWSLCHRPFFLLKSAMSLDGKVATRIGRSKYLTGSKALELSHQLRRAHDAIMVGVQTVLADNPQLTYRGRRRGKDPVRVIVDSRGRTSPSAQIFHTGSTEPTLVFTTDAIEASWEREIFLAGGEVVVVGQTPDGRVNLLEVAEHLADRHILSVVVEGGPTLHASLLANRLADGWVGFYAPLLIGSPGLSAIGGKGYDELDDCPAIRLRGVRQLGSDAVIRGDFMPFPITVLESGHIVRKEA